MIILSGVSQSVQISLEATPGTELPWLASFVDFAGDTYRLGSEAGVSDGTTPVTVMSAPGASRARQLKHFSIFNSDAAVCTVTVSHTLRKMISAELESGSTLQYNDGNGWSVLAGSAPPAEEEALPPPETPSEYWSLDEVSSTADRIGGILGVHLEVGGSGAMPVVSGIRNGGIKFTLFGNDQLETRYPEDVGLLPYTLGNDISFAFWFRNITNEADANPVPVVTFTSGPSYNKYLYIDSTSSGTDKWLGVHTTDGQGSALISPLTVNHWYLMTLVYHGSTGLADVYLDTTLIATTDVATYYASSATSTMKLECDGDEMNGDELYLWTNHALTLDEITYIYNGGAGRAPWW